jgi:hypothetical protein
MWRLSSAAAKRERITAVAAAKKLSKKQFHLKQHVSLRSLSATTSSPDVAVQLDYYMSLQFAGVACALVNGKNCLTFIF